MEEITDSISVAEEGALRLSFCDLPNSPGSLNPSPITQSAQPDNLFEFVVPPPPPAPPSRYSVVILFGKFINTEDQKRDRFAAAKSKSFSGDTNYRVNFSSLTSMSAKSRRRMFMSGPVKFRPEMELSAIKQRQAVRAPAPANPSPPPSGKRKSRWEVVKSRLARPLGAFRRS